MEYFEQFINNEMTIRTHDYMECPLPNGKTAWEMRSYHGDCDECEQYYREEMHFEFCEPDCPARTETEEKICVGCKCEHCKEGA
jgi:hypothetical protein